MQPARARWSWLRGRRRNATLLGLIPLVVVSIGWSSIGPAGGSRVSHVTLQASGLGPVKFGATQKAAVSRLSELLGHRPTGHSSSVCVGGIKNVSWNDLVVQFKKGQFSGYRYWVTQANPTVWPKLATANGITLGNSFSTLQDRYGRSLRQTGTDFWSAGQLTFGINSGSSPAPPNSPVYEIKVAVCPAAL